MSSFIILNGSFLPSGTSFLTADNRGFRYGDGVFETIRVMDGHILLADLHFERLLSGVRLLQFDPSFIDITSLGNAILELCRRNGHAASARVRLSVFRGDMGQDDAFPNYVIQSWPLDGAGMAVDDAGLTLGVFPDGRKSCDLFSSIKSNNYLLYSMAALYARQHGWDDCLVLNSQGRVADSSIANLFYVRDGVIFTPPLSEGGVAGVMRRRLLDLLPSVGFRVEECPVTLEDIRTAEEVFLTNAIRGVRWAGSFEGTTYGSKVAVVLSKLVNENTY